MSKCKYYLPCGMCDKFDKRCHQYEEPVSDSNGNADDRYAPTVDLGVTTISPINIPTVPRTITKWTSNSVSQVIRTCSTDCEYAEHSGGDVKCRLDGKTVAYGKTCRLAEDEIILNN